MVEIIDLNFNDNEITTETSPTGVEPKERAPFRHGYTDKMIVKTTSGWCVLFAGTIEMSPQQVHNADIYLVLHKYGRDGSKQTARRSITTVYTSLTVNDQLVYPKIPGTYYAAFKLTGIDKLSSMWVLSAYYEISGYTTYATPQFCVDPNNLVSECPLVEDSATLRSMLEANLDSLEAIDLNELFN